MLQHSSTVSHKNPAGQAHMMIQKPGRVIVFRFEPGPPGAVVSNVPHDSNFLLEVKVCFLEFTKDFVLVESLSHD